LKKIVASLVLLLAFAACASAAPPPPSSPVSHEAVLPWAARLHLGGWRYLGFNDREVLFATDGSNKLHAPYLRFWIRSERFGDGQTGGGSSKRLVEVDCRNYRWTMLDSRTYAENDLKGPVLASGKTAPWQKVDDPDLMHALVFVCLGH
jgi:hypothetical protein